MEMLFLGTGAAEGLPSPFCECTACKHARMYGGKEIKTRSCALLNDDTLIDCSPDICIQAEREHLCLSHVTSIVFTHADLDHLDVPSLMLRFKKGSSEISGWDGKNNIVDIYGNKAVKQRIEDGFASNRTAEPDLMRFHELQNGKEYRIGSCTFIPLKANHIQGEDCHIFIIDSGISAFLYCNDTGTLPEETQQALCIFRHKFSTVSLDCARGVLEGDAHMGLAEVTRLVNRLRAANRITEDTPVYLNHYSHMCRLSPSQFETVIESRGMKLAYDGLRVHFV